MTEKSLIGRLAMRIEGENWNAYWAPHQDSMKDAAFLGSIRMMFVHEREERRTAFLDLMRACFADQVEEVAGVRPEWGGVKPAPESERSGNA